MEQVNIIGLDLAKNVFQVHGVTAAGRPVIRRQLRRSQMLDFFGRLPSCLVGIEACAGAHYWARELTALGHEVRLMPPSYVKPYVKRGKTDAADAEAICEALIAAGALDALFARLDRAITEAGYLPMAGQIVDATLVAAPRQRNTEEEKAQIRAGEKAGDIWPDRPAKARQKDTDARWTVKFSKAKPAADGKPQLDIAVPAFSYKSHISIDRRHGIIRRAKVTDAAAHARRKLREVFERDGSEIAAEGLRRIAEFYRIEAAIRGRPAEERRAVRQARTAPLVEDFGLWLRDCRARLSARSRLGEKLGYIARQWDGLQVFLADGRVEIDSNAVENTIRPLALNRKNALFAGHDEGGQSWGRIASLIETAKMNGVDPFAYLRDTLEAIAGGHPAARIDELLPWANPGCGDAAQRDIRAA